MQRRYNHVANTKSPPTHTRVNHVNIVRFNETINGRLYVIETLLVGRDRWRAHIVRTPGGTTALMPFYGATPDQAKCQLADWLERASRKQPAAAER